MSTAPLRHRIALRVPLFWLSAHLFQCHATGKFDCKYNSELFDREHGLDEKLLVESTLEIVLSPHFLNCPSGDVSVAGNITWKSLTLECVNHLQCDNIPFSLWFVGSSIPPRIF